MKKEKQKPNQIHHKSNYKKKEKIKQNHKNQSIISKNVILVA